MTKEYKLNIDTRILELLGPSLYTNIYYVLAELIANAYDADASNVYIVSNEDSITVEDDGLGMSYKDGDITEYLNVGKVSRTSEEQSYTNNLQRRRMGRKGVGKLAALSVSENVIVKTIKNGEKSGFVLTRHPSEEGLLPGIPEDEISLERVEGDGSAIVMQDPQYSLHKGLDVITRNILKMFPLVDSEFRIHVIRGDEQRVIEGLDEATVAGLGALITLGEEFEHLGRHVPDDFPERRGDLVRSLPAKTITVKMQNNNGEYREYELEVRGWIGSYRTTRGRKAERSDFPDNFISLFANNKLGEFNILPSVGQNKLNEVYIVGQLHIDLFELTELPDMALSNRQGYKSDDPRYEAVVNYVRNDLLAEALRMRELYVDIKNKEKMEKKLEEQEATEAQLRQEIRRFEKVVVEDAIKRITLMQDGRSTFPAEGLADAIASSINAGKLELGLKKKADSQKKRILISQTSKDKPLADIIYNMLLFNGVPAEEILYTNCDDEVSRIPEGMPIYEYLRKFFVQSYSDQLIHVIFVTSDNTQKAWGAITEVGAAWITQVDHKIFNIPPFTPGHPLDNAAQWHTTHREADTLDLWMNPVDADIFCQKIEAICNKLGYSPNSRTDNTNHLGTLVSVKT